MGTKESTEDLQEINKKNKSLIRRKNKRIKLLYGLIIVILVIFGGLAFFGMTKYNKLQQDNKRLSNPEESAKQEIEKLSTSNLILFYENHINKSLESKALKVYQKPLNLDILISL